MLHSTLETQQSSWTGPGMIWSWIGPMVYCLICYFLILFLYLLIAKWVFKGDLSIYARTASKYDECLLLRLPNLRLCLKVSCGLKNNLMIHIYYILSWIGCVWETRTTPKVGKTKTTIIQWCPALRIVLRTAQCRWGVFNLIY